MGQSTHPQIDALKAHAERLVSLLSDPYPRQVTWNLLLLSHLKEIAAFLPTNLLEEELARRSEWERASSPPGPIPEGSP